jgi:hypothetical protein
MKAINGIRHVPGMFSMAAGSSKRRLFYLWSGPAACYLIRADLVGRCRLTSLNGPTLAVSRVNQTGSHEQANSWLRRQARPDRSCSLRSRPNTSPRQMTMWRGKENGRAVER